jgi:histidinol-phosphate aminotransferase
MERTFVAPPPRPDVARPDLTRPQWTVGTMRSDKFLWVDKNENLDPQLSEFTHGLLKELDPRALCTYPECAPLYKKLSEFLDIPAECLLLTAGSDGAIRSVFEAYVSPGDGVIHTVPTFAMYSVYSKMYGAHVTGLEYEASDNGPLLKVENVLEKINAVKPKLFCLPNPDSPTGTVFTASEMKSIIEGCGKVGALILVDEAYFPFYDESVVGFTQKYNHLVVARTFAKAWGLAGLRIGYLAASPDVAKILHKVRPMYEVNTLSVMYMEKMLDHREQMEESVKRLKAGKKYFLDEMSNLGFKTLHGEGNFLHVNFGEKKTQIISALDKMVLFRKDFSEPCLKGFSRFSATTIEQFAPIVRKIQEIAK